MNTNPHSHAPESSGKPSQKSGAYNNNKGGLNLECDVQQVHMSVMVRRPNTFVYLVCLYIYMYEEIFFFNGDTMQLCLV